MWNKDVATEATVSEISIPADINSSDLSFIPKLSDWRIKCSSQQRNDTDPGFLEGHPVTKNIPNWETPGKCQ